MVKLSKSCVVGRLPATVIVTFHKGGKGALSTPALALPRPAVLHIITLCSHSTKPPLCASPRLFALPNYALLKTPLIEDIHS